MTLPFRPDGSLNTDPKVPALPFGPDGTLRQTAPVDDAGRLEAQMRRTGWTNPTDMGRAFAIGRETGVEPEVIGRNLERVEQERAPQMDWVKFLNEHPATSRWLLEREGNAAVAKDDLSHLSGMERTFGRWRFPSLEDWGAGFAGEQRAGALRQVEPGVPQVIYRRLKLSEERGRLGIVPPQFHDDATRARVAELDEELSRPLSESESVLESVARMTAEIAPSTFESIEQGGIGAAVGAATGGAIGLVAGGPAGAAAGAAFGAKVGGTLNATQTIFTLEAGNAALDYGALRDEAGRGPNETHAYATGLAYGTVSSAIELLGLGIAGAAFKPILANASRKAVAGALVNPTMRGAFIDGAVAWGKAVAGETATELAQTGLSLADEQELRFLSRWTGTADLPNIEGERVAEELWTTLVTTAVGMGVLGGIGAGGVTISQAARVSEAERTRAQFTRLADEVQASQVAKLAPEEAAELVERMVQAQDAPRQVFAPVDRLQILLQDNEVPLEQFLATVGINPDDYAAQVAAGGDVAIPMGPFVAKVLGTDLGRALIDDVRVAADQLTPREAQEARTAIEQNSKALQDEMQKLATEDVTAPDEVAVREQIRAGLEGAGLSADEIAVQMKVLPNWYIAIARQFKAQDATHRFANAMNVLNWGQGLRVLDRRRAKITFDTVQRIRKAEQSGKNPDEIAALRLTLRKLMDDRVTIRSALDAPLQVNPLRDEEGRVAASLKTVSTDALAVEWMALRDALSNAEGELGGILDNPAFMTAQESPTTEEANARLTEGFPALWNIGDEADNWTNLQRITRELRSQIRKAERSLPRLERALTERGVTDVAAYVTERDLVGDVSFDFGQDVAFQRGQGIDGLEALYQAAFHGTPHTWAPEPGFPFGRVRADKVGTGEGAAAFGWGVLYAAEAEGTAAGYRKDLTELQISTAKRLLKVAGEDADVAIANATSEIERLRALPNAGNDPERQARLISINEVAISALSEYKRTGEFGSGNLYRVDIPDAAVATYLDWDKPLSEQAPEVREMMLNAKTGSAFADRILRKAARPKGDTLYGNGGEFYRQLTAAFALDAPLNMTAERAENAYQRNASEALLAAGIRGIKYLDAGSRGQGEGSRNLVVFDESDVTITHRNGEPVTAQERTDFLAQEGMQETLGDTIDVDGVSRPTTNSTGQPIHPTAEGVRNFWRWATEDGRQPIADGEGRPIVLYHGTTGDFSEFDLRRANVESDWGVGVYATTAVSDVSVNYAGEGPDLTNKIQQAAERIADETDRDYSDPAVLEEARREIGVVNSGAVMPLYGRAQNPVVVGGVGETSLTFEAEMDEDGEFTGEESGTLVDFILAIRDISSRYEGGDPENFIQSLLYEGESVAASDVYRIAREAEDFQYMTDEDGKLVANEIVRQAFEAIGFDAIVDNTVYDKFGGGRKVGQKMVGVESGTTHYIMFANTDVKSALGNSGAFGPSADILMQEPLPKMTKAQKEIFAELQKGAYISEFGNGATLKGADGKDIRKLTWGAWEKFEALGLTSLQGSQAMGSGGKYARIYALKPDMLAQGTGRPNAFYLPSERVIGLLATANESSVPHEFAHDYLRTLAYIGQLPDAPAVLKADLSVVMKELGNADPNNLTPAQEEKFARSFESHLETGKAPTVGLARAYHRYRIWLGRIYAKAREMLIPVSDNLRGVFDRMLAIDDELSDAVSAPEAAPMFETAEDAGLTPEQFERYRRAFGDRDVDAGATLVKKVMGEQSKATRDAWKAREAELTKAVEQDVDAEPVYRMVAVLGDAEKVGKLNREALDVFGPDTWKAFAVKGLTAAEGTQSVDTLALEYGFRDGAAVVDALMRVTPRNDEVRRRVRAVLTREFGDMLGDSVAMADAVADAMHRESQLDALTLELNALGAKVGQEPANVPALKELAREQVAKMRVTDLRPARFLRAERTAATGALRAARAGKLMESYQFKRKQALNHLLYREASKAEERSDRARAYAQRMLGNTAQVNLGKAGVQYAEAMDAILDSYEFTTRSRPQMETQERLRAQVAAWSAEVALASTVQTEDGPVPLVVPEVPESVVGIPMHYRLLSVERLDAIYGTMQSIYHTATDLGKEKRKAKAMRFEERVALLVDTAEINWTPERKQLVLSRGKVSTFDIAGVNLALSKIGNDAHGEMVKVEMLFRLLDGDVPNGPWQEAFSNAASDSLADFNRKMEAFTARYKEAMDLIPKDRINGFFKQLVQVEGVVGAGTSNPRMTGDQVFRLLLNYGNESSRNAVNAGEYGTVRPFSDANARKLFALLTPQEMQAAQKVWDAVSMFWGEMSELHRDMTGISAQKVDASPLTVKALDGSDVTLRGGYFPLKYDSELSDKAYQQDQQRAEQTAEGLVPFVGAVRSTTQQGQFEQRMKANGRIVDLSAQVVSRHMTAVVYDLTHRRLVYDVQKLVLDPRIADIITRTAGAGVYRKAVMPWAKRLAGEGSPPTNWIEKLAVRARAGSSTMGLGFRVTTIMLQYLGLGQTMALIGPTYVARGFREIRRYGKGAFEAADALAPAVAYRALSVNRDLTDLAKELRAKGKWTDTYEMAFSGITFMDRQVSMVAFWGGYYQWLDQNPLDVSGAVRAGEQAIRLSQGANDVKDLATVMAGNQVSKLLTSFFSNGSVLYQLFWRGTRQAKAPTAAQKRAFLVTMMGAWLLPAVIEPMMRGSGPDDDEDVSDQVAWWTWQIASYPMQALPIARDLARMFEPGAKFNAEFAPPFLRPFTVTGEAMVGVVSAASEDEDFEVRDLEAIVKAFGYWKNLPLDAPWGMGKRLYKWMTGEVAPESVMDGLRYVGTNRPIR